MAEKMTLRGVVSEFCLFGDRVEALEAINKLIRAAAAQARAEGRAEGLRLAARVVEQDCSVSTAQRIRSLAAGVAGQPSGDAKEK